MNALVYLELRYALHNAVAVFRSPWRLVLWGAYLLFVGGGLVARITYRSHSPFGVRHGSSIAGVAPAVAGMLVLSIGVTVIAAALGRVATYRTRAEAILLSNGGTAPLAIAFWLQLRRIASTFGRRLLTISLYFVVFVPQRFGTPAQTAFGLAGVLGSLAVLLGLELPVYLLARRGWGAALIAGGAAAAVYGAAYGGASFLVLAVPWRPALAFLHDTPLDLGAFAHGVVAGEPRAFGAMLAAVIALVAAALLLGREAVPELYAAAERGLELRERARAGRSRIAPATAASAPSSRYVPPGAWTLVWKDWLGVKRARGAAQSWTIGALAAAGIGAASAWTLDASGGLAGAAPLFGAAFSVLLVAPVGTARGLAADFGKPIWWLGAAGLRARIHALVIARSWRGAAIFTLALAAFAICANEPLLALVAPVGAFAVFWSLGALGTALYALFPFDVDRRGPMLFLRALAVAVYAAPVAAIALLLGVLDVPPALVLIAGSVLLAGEGVAAIEVACLRVAENGTNLAAYERVT